MSRVLHRAFVFARSAGFERIHIPTKNKRIKERNSRRVFIAVRGCTHWLSIFCMSAVRWFACEGVIEDGILSRGVSAVTRKEATRARCGNELINNVPIV